VARCANERSDQGGAKRHHPQGSGGAAPSQGPGAERWWGAKPPGNFLENRGVLVHLRAILAPKLLKIYFSECTILFSKMRNKVSTGGGIKQTSGETNSLLRKVIIYTFS